jgi:hypothetical protein
VKERMYWQRQERPTLKCFLNSSRSHVPTSARMALPLASVAVLPAARMSWQQQHAAAARKCRQWMRLQLPCYQNILWLTLESIDTQQSSTQGPLSDASALSVLAARQCNPKTNGCSLNMCSNLGLYFATACGTLAWSAVTTLHLRSSCTVPPSAWWGSVY